MQIKKRFLFRIIIPAYPKFTIYTNSTGIMTALGPLCIATAAGKLDHWDVEVIDENNCRSRHCPRTGEGYPDHEALQSIRPADVVGFYGSMSSSVPRLYEVASYYKSAGALTLAGGKHIEFLPGEGLSRGLDIAVLGEGEEAIRSVLLAWERTRNETSRDRWMQELSAIPGLGFLKNGGTFLTEARPVNMDLDSLPFPDFGYLLYGKIRIYPVNRTRGCNMNCEFCTVKDKTRTASPQWMVNQIIHLVETRGARKFFDTSDHFAADREEAIEFCNLIADYQKRSGITLYFIVQTRITDAKYPELLEAMKRANIRMIAIGYESPIDEELIMMNKGYVSRDMIKWSREFHKYGFYIHAMMIFGYPLSKEHQSGLSLKERVSRFRKFISQARVDTTQVLLAIPFAGTELRERLEKENRVFPVSRIGWEYYDGQFPIFEPDDGTTPEENMFAVIDIMGRFYSARNIFRLFVSIVFHFPRMFILPLFSLLSFRMKFLSKVFSRWYHDHMRNPVLRFGGSFIVRKWKKHLKVNGFRERLLGARTERGAALPGPLKDRV
jgi:radical SAM superfamily enzyme YgiQ (UPF0313 family)